MRRAAVLALFLTASLASCDSKTDKAGSTPASTAPTADAGKPITDPVAYAKELMAQAGYPGGRGFPRLEVLYNTDEGHKKIAAAVQHFSPPATSSAR